MKKIIFYISIICICISCQKVIELDLPNSEPKIVIEGYVTDKAGPYTVKITNSVKYSASNVYTPITDATVVISDNTGQVDTLKYASNGEYKTKKLVGKEGNTYTLTVVSNNKTYTAVSKMPYKVNLDTIRFVRQFFGSDTIFNIIPSYEDPGIKGNYYRFLLHVNDTLDKTHFVDNDNIQNGQINQKPLFKNNNDDPIVRYGSKISLEMQCIDLVTYNYFFALAELSADGSGATPANPLNNIKGDALGLFSAYTTQTKKIVVK